MIFRGSTFMTNGHRSPPTAIWFEAHSNGDGQMIVAKLEGVPQSVGRPGWFKRRFGKVESSKAITMPAKAVELKTVATPVDALNEILLLEEGVIASGATVFDIGELRPSEFGGASHYAGMDAFLQVDLPEAIHRYANEFVKELGVRFLLGDVPQYILEGAREAVKCYHKHGRLAPATAA